MDPRAVKLLGTSRKASAFPGSDHVPSKLLPVWKLGPLLGHLYALVLPEVENSDSVFV